MQMRMTISRSKMRRKRKASGGLTPRTAGEGGCPAGRTSLNCLLLSEKFSSVSRKNSVGKEEKPRHS